MTVLLKLWLMSPPTVQESNGSNVTHTAIWHAEMDEPTTGDHVLAFAREQVGTLPSGAEEVPDPGDPLFFANGKVDADIPLDPVAWAALPGNSGGYYDLTSYALDFNCQPRTPGRCTKWTIQVTWRQPFPGQYEAPQFQALYNNPAFSTMPETDPVWLAAREYFLEFTVSQREQVLGYLVETPFTNPTIAGPDRVQMVMSNGEPHEPIPVADHESVMVISHLSRSYMKAAELNNTFGRTISADNITLDGNVIERHKARYLSTVVGQTMRHRGSTYYRLETRLALARYGHFHDRPSIGSYYKNTFDESPTRPFSAEGYPLDRIPLDDQGDWITPAETLRTVDVRTYCVYDPVIYAPTFNDP